ncbi:MAG: hypothetical protein ACRD1T_17000, partial [Acidimicrobiia bacterium]
VVCAWLEDRVLGKGHSVRGNYHRKAILRKQEVKTQFSTSIFGFLLSERVDSLGRLAYDVMCYTIISGKEVKPVENDIH